MDALAYTVFTVLLLPSIIYFSPGRFSGTPGWRCSGGITLSLIKFRPRPRVSRLPEMFSIPAGFIDLLERTEEASSAL
uniref:Uncharacterized protein n=1 Tax=Electrophorus electricus TaxID=8005 RepID=A0A4W4EQ53_ELEEL